MSVQLNLNQLLPLVPNARSGYRGAAANAQQVLDYYGVSKNKLRLCHFFAQVLHETGGLAILEENLNYSATRLPQVWPSRFMPRGPLDPNSYAMDPAKLANEVYGNRMGNNGSNDGYIFRGRGMLQLTGRDSYANATRLLRARSATSPDFMQQPEMVLSSDWCIDVAAAIFADKGCNELADQDDLKKVTYRINGGYIGLASRQEWLTRLKASL